MSEKTYTHKDLASLLGVSETTVKSYRRKFPGCIPVANQGKPIRFTEAAAKVAMRIRDLFETGMSVEEVHARLSKEFGWITQQPPTENAGSHGAMRRVSRVAAKGYDIGPELSVGVSNMAKTMVTMTQQQKSLLSRLEHIENMLEELGLKDKDGFAELRSANAAAAQEREMKQEERFNHLHEAFKSLSGTVRSLAEELASFIADKDKPTPPVEIASTGSENLTDENAAGSHPSWDEEDAPPAEAAKVARSAEILKLHPETREQKTSPPAVSQIAETAQPNEPPRHFFGLPMVVRTQQGRYVSAGGRGRGRFSITDLKALLSYGAAASKHITMRWEAHGQGWWLFLEQEENERPVRLLLMEMPTQKSGNVAEILKLRNVDTDMHPAEFAVLLEQLAD